jgi:hypothetical protein
MGFPCHRHLPKAKHEDRRKIGCFDFKIFLTGGDAKEALEHRQLIESAKMLNRDLVERVFRGEDVNSLGANRQEVGVLAAIQAAMLEQEINWGMNRFSRGLISHRL